MKSIITRYQHSNVASGKLFETRQFDHPKFQFYGPIALLLSQLSFVQEWITQCRQSLFFKRIFNIFLNDTDLYDISQTVVDIRIISEINLFWVFTPALGNLWGGGQSISIVCIFHPSLKSQFTLSCEIIEKLVQFLII